VDAAVDRRKKGEQKMNPEDDTFTEDVYGEEIIYCAEGYAEDEWCNPESRRGIEYCEFLCPFKRLNDEERGEKPKP
jgi:hypothetical protein